MRRFYVVSTVMGNDEKCLTASSCWLSLLSSRSACSEILRRAETKSRKRHNIQPNATPHIFPTATLCASHPAAKPKDRPWIILHTSLPFDSIELQLQLNSAHLGCWKFRRPSGKRRNPVRCLLRSPRPRLFCPRLDPPTVTGLLRASPPPPRAQATQLRLRVGLGVGWQKRAAHCITT